MLNWIRLLSIRRLRISVWSLVLWRWSNNCITKWTKISHFKLKFQLVVTFNSFLMLWDLRVLRLKMTCRTSRKPWRRRTLYRLNLNLKIRIWNVKCRQNRVLWRCYRIRIVFWAQKYRNLKMMIYISVSRLVMLVVKRLFWRLICVVRTLKFKCFKAKLSSYRVLIRLIWVKTCSVRLILRRNWMKNKP